MEVKLKERLQESGPYGIIKNVEALYQRIVRRFSVRAPEAAVVSSTPYDTKAYEGQMVEVDLKISQALAEAQRMRNRVI